MKRVTVSLSDEIERQLRAEAEARRLSISELVRNKLDRADACACEPPDLGFIGIGRAKPPYDKMTFAEMRTSMVDGLVSELDE